MPRYEMLDTLLNVIGRVQQLQRAAEVRRRPWALICPAVEGVASGVS